MKTQLNEELGRIRNIMNFFKKNTDNTDGESERKRFTCTDCGEYDYKMYMVNNDLWKQYGTERDTLCMSCLQKRVGRELTKDDFMDYKETLVNLHNDEVQNIMNY